MAKKIEKIDNYFYITDTITGEKEVDDKIEDIQFTEKDSVYTFFKENRYLKSYKFTDLVDSNSVVWTSETVLKSFLTKNTGERPSIDVNVQDPENTIIDFYFYNTLTTPILSSNTTADNNIVNFTVGHLIAIGDHLHFIENGVVTEFEVLSVNVNAITLDSPIDYPFTTASTIHRGSREMAVDGSITPQSFSITPPIGISYHITEIILVINDNSTMDMSLFGSLPSLTNGCVVRKHDGVYKNYFNYKNNGQFGARAAGVPRIDDKTGGGEHTFTGSANWRNFGSVVKIDGDLGESLEHIVQDDLSTLTSVRMIAIGHIEIK